MHLIFYGIKEYISAGAVVRFEAKFYTPTV
jgi:hypothetical protein